MKRTLLSFMLCLAMLIPLVFTGIPAAMAEGLDADDYCTDISEYRSGEQKAWTYPAKEGYVFAGWYQDALLTEPVAENVITGGAYAKFVDEAVLSIKCQMNALANIDDNTMDLRMLTSVDSLTYRNVGFRFQTGSVSVNFMTKTVYRSIQANGLVVEPAAFSDASHYIVGHSLNHIPKSNFSSTFTITPMWVTLDGTTVLGVARKMTIREDYTAAPDITKTYTGGNLEFWFYNVKIHADQWICFDVEGVPAGGAGSVYFMIYDDQTQLEGFNNQHPGSRYWYVAKGDKIRFYGQVYGEYADNNVGIRLFTGHGASIGSQITVSNLRITDEPDVAGYYNLNNGGGSNAYFDTGDFMDVSASAGQILSYKVSLEHGNLLNQVGLNDPKSWVFVNGRTTGAWNTFKVSENSDGTQTVEVKVTEDIGSFKPTFDLQNINGVTDNKMVISDIQVNDALNWTQEGNKQNYEYAGVNVASGEMLSFDVESGRALTVYLDYAGKSEVVSYLKTQKGKLTVTYTFPEDVDGFTIMLRDWADSTDYVATVSNIKIIAPKVDTSNLIRVACVGDSITQGVGASSSAQAYPGQLQQFLGDEYAVLNAGMSGTQVRRNSETPYTETTQYQRGVAFNPHIVVIMLGTNDAYADRCTTADRLAEFEYDYKALINTYKALETNPKIFLALPPHCYGTDDQRQYNLETYIIPLITEIANEYGLEVIDMNTFTSDHADWFPDTLHPNDTAYVKIAEEFSKYILAGGLQYEEDGDGPSMAYEELFGE